MNAKLVCIAICNAMLSILKESQNDLGESVLFFAYVLAMTNHGLKKHFWLVRDGGSGSLHTVIL